MRLVADSFAWPFRAASAATWLIGGVCVLLFPLLFIPLLGYAVAATRSVENDAAAGPPRWQFSARLLTDGFWASLAVLLSMVPFAILLTPLSGVMQGVTPGEPFPHLFALLILALPWGLIAVLLLPHATAKFADSADPRDLFDPAASLRAVRSDFMTWNVSAAAMVTAWAIGLACVGLLFVGLVPGVFYAILVSAHAAAALKVQGPGPSAR